MWLARLDTHGSDTEVPTLGCCFAQVSDLMFWSQGTFLIKTTIYLVGIRVIIGKVLVILR